MTAGLLPPAKLAAPATANAPRPTGRGALPLEPAAYGSALFLAVLLTFCPALEFFSTALVLASRGGMNWLKALLPFTAGCLALFLGGRWSLFHVLAYANRRRDLPSPPPPPERFPFVSILVPAHNEGETIERALESLARIDYPSYEVIVVDDGSTDGTLALARKFEGRHGGCSIQVHSKPNGGKWSAHNFAFQHSKGELILCVDADSRLDPQALKLLAARLTSPQIAAVAGQVRVRNRVNVLTRLQALEYLICNGLVRMAQSLFGTVLVVPGPIGLFRRRVLEEVHGRFGARCLDGPGHVTGPFEGDTFAEDFDLSVAILSLGYQIVYEPAAVSRTKAPEWSFGLLNQRYRWVRGSMQVLRKYFRRARSSPRLLNRRLLAFIGSTYLLEILALPLANLATLAFVFMFVANGGSLLALLGWFLAYLLLQLHAGVLAAAIHQDDFKLLAVLPFYHLYHAVFLNCSWLFAFLDEVRGSKMRW